MSGSRGANSDSSDNPGSDGRAQRALGAFLGLPIRVGNAESRCMAFTRTVSASVGLPVNLLGFSNCVPAVTEVAKIAPILWSCGCRATVLMDFVISIGLSIRIHIVACHAFLSNRLLEPRIGRPSTFVSTSELPPALLHIAGRR